ncbi:MAG: glycosyltransferase [Acidimicrobiia bacterium]|nr:glycosyltransferase [Acidimicrobiia bacterium]
MTSGPDEPGARSLGVVMPCYNEAATLEEVTARVLDSPYVAELVIVDDGSTDGTLELARDIDDPRVRVFAQPVNMGKGAALRRGFAEVTAPYVIVQDADLEYDPADYATVLEPLLAGSADVVYGSRFMGGRPHRVLYYWHSVGNRILTVASNMLTNLNLTDMETCYKAFRREVIQSFEIREDRFGFEPEITAKVARGGWRVYEVGISYDGRTYAEGKKIGWRDGVRAMYGVVRYSSFFDSASKRFSGAPDRSGGPVAFDESDSELSEALDSLLDADNYADWIADLARPHLGERVLEIGAGHGEMTERLAAGGRTVVATDLSKRCVDALRERFAGRAGIEVLHADVAGLDDDRRFDSAVLVNVLEHIDDDDAALRLIHDVLEPGGRLVVFVPAFDGLYSEFDRSIGHRRRYRRAELISLADRCGYRIVEARYVNSVGAVAWWLMARQLRQVPTRRWSTVAYDRGVVPWLRRMEARREPGLGQSVLLVAEKPA